MTPQRWSRMKEVFGAALEKPGQERPAFLDSACAGDAELRAEVERLLAESDAASLHSPASGFLNAAELAPGDTVAHYRIQARLGEGGMGVVYKAIDTRLGRSVALKFVKAQFSHRWEREARAVAALNHPHIATLYEVGDHEGSPYLAMELVDGRPLKGPLPLKQAIEYGIQMADALAAAHAAGIVHRDLKPANILVTEKGSVKVLDFGLAKLAEPEGAPASTQTAGLAGTPGYLAPEQIEGKPADTRSDIFAFGCILYELLSGRRAFPGETITAALTATAITEPKPLEGAPERLDELVRLCLRKDPESRLQHIGDARIMLEALREGIGSAGTGAPVAPARRSWPIYALAVIGILAAIGAAVWMLRGRQTAAPRRAEWQQLTNFTDSATQPALSPDGRILTFVRGPGTFYTPGQIYVKLLPDGEPAQLTHDTRSKMSPVFTPDGSRIAYTVAWPWDTWIVPVLGGEPRLMLANASGLRWIGPDRVLFSEIESGVHMALVASRESRTEKRDVYVPPHERGMAHRSAISPDGKSVLLAEMDNSGWLPCRVAPFDGSSSGRRVGPQPGACTDAAWSRDGKWMYLASQSGGKFHIWRQPLDGGAPEQITSGPNEEEGIAIAPDGQSLITSVGQMQSEIWFHDAAGERQVSSQGFARAPFLSADGKRIYYIVEATLNFNLPVGELWMWDLDSNHSECLLPGIVISGYDVSPDNKRLLYSVVKPDLKSEIWLAALDRRFPPRRLSSGDDSYPRFGPDGDIIFRSSEGKMNYLYRMRGDGTGRQRVSESPILTLGQISPDGRWAVVWGAVPDEESPNAFLLFPTDGGASVRICDRCSVRWAPDGKYFYIHLAGMGGEAARNYAIPLRRGSMVPALPPAGVKSPDDLKNLPGVQIIDAVNIATGMSPSAYAFMKASAHRNLYRIPLP
jgi:Tol biopolymer transport system component